MSDKLEIYVGPNASGKSYTLLGLYNDRVTECVFINEIGVAHSLRLPKDVVINFETMKYIYQNEAERGNKKPPQEEDIIFNIHRLVQYCEEKSARLRSLNSRSEGQNKLLNVYQTILSTNMNLINTFIIDEPENNLDDNFLKQFIELIDELNISNIKVIMATHSFRLLEILEFNFDDVHLLSRESVFYNDNVLSNQEIKDIYIQSSTIVKEMINNQNIVVPKRRLLKYYFSETDLLEYFIDTFLKTSDFLKLLFYNEVFIFEGKSELIALKSIMKYNPAVMNSIIVNGKDFIHLFSSILQYMGKHVVVIMDEDDNQPNSFAFHLNSLFTESGTQRVIYLSRDFEQRFGIDLNSYATRINPLIDGDESITWKHVKPIASYKEFRDESKKIQLKDLLDEAVDYEWN